MSESDERIDFAANGGSTYFVYYSRTNYPPGTIVERDTGPGIIVGRGNHRFRIPIDLAAQVGRSITELAERFKA